MAAGALPRGITRYRGRYRVRLNVDGTTHALGSYDTLTDARAVLEIAKGERARGTFVPPAQIRAERRAAEHKAQTDALTLGEWAQQWLVELVTTTPRCAGERCGTRRCTRAAVMPECRGEEPWRRTGIVRVS